MLDGAGPARCPKDSGPIDRSDYGADVSTYSLADDFAFDQAYSSTYTVALDPIRAYCHSDHVATLVRQSIATAVRGTIRRTFRHTVTFPSGADHTMNKFIPTHDRCAKLQVMILFPES